MVVWGGSAIKGNVQFARAFAKDGDNMLLMLVELLVNSMP
jgi:hypothetical protein